MDEKTMTDWDEMKDKLRISTPKYGRKEADEPTFNQLIAEGDRLQQENKSLRTNLKICKESKFWENAYVDVNKERLQLHDKLEVIRTGLLELIENGYITHCVTDVMNLLDESDNPKKQNEKTVS